MHLRSILVLSALVSLPGCSPPDREAEVRAFLDDAVAAAEARSTGFFRDHIAEEYADARGQRRAGLIDMIRGFFLINSTVEVISRVQRVELDGDDFAEAVIQAAVIGNRGGGVLDINGNFYTIELELARDGNSWRVIGAAWDRLVE